MEQSQSMENQILGLFFEHVQDTEISRKCMDKIFSENSDSKLKKKLFEECFLSKFALFDALEKEKLEKLNN